MPTLYALFVAINDYPDPRHRLDGCVNDMQLFRDYLESYCAKSGLGFLPLVLADADATRDNFIKGFELFQPAGEGDTCLLFYAGHGARCESPEAFWHLSPSRMVESIVCWDSRQPGGRDLMDKELSFLIWQATKDKKAHFLLITDCCHSGSITRGVKERRIREVGEAAPPDAYLGFEHYRPAGEGRYSPPRGQYVHLAAARDNQTAKEVHVKGAPRGVFSYCLLESLAGGNGQLSYAELANRISIRIRSIVGDQSPQVEALPADDRNRSFLSGAQAPARQAYLAGYDRQLGWYVNAGTLQGLPSGDDKQQNVFRLLEGGQTARSTEVQAQYTKVEGLDGLDTKKQYALELAELAAPRFRLAWQADSEPEGVEALQKLLEAKASDFFQWVQDVETADYLVHASQGSYFLSRRFDDNPLFQPVPGYEEAAIIDFINKLERVARWQQLLRLSNPATSIKGDEASIELFRVTEAGNTDDNAPTELVDWRSTAAFEYTRSGGQWQQPAFQLKVTNTGQRTLWVSLLYLSNNFGITNQLLPKQELGPGQEAWAVDVFEGYPYRTLPLQVEDEYLLNGIHTVDEYLKLLICTDEFDTNGFNQEGLLLGRPLQAHRQVGFRRQNIRRPDWTDKEVHLQLHRPK